MGAEGTININTGVSTTWPPEERFAWSSVSLPWCEMLATPALVMWVVKSYPWMRKLMRIANLVAIFWLGNPLYLVPACHTISLSDLLALVTNCYPHVLLCTYHIRWYTLALTAIHMYVLSKSVACPYNWLIFISSHFRECDISSEYHAKNDRILY